MVNVVIYQGPSPGVPYSVHVLSSNGTNTFSYTANSSDIYVQIRQSGTYLLDNIRLYREYEDTVIVGGYVASGGYHYSFQNQEKHDEIRGKGKYINYKYRGYDPRVGRLDWMVDPLAAKYPYYSPYAFSGNRVIDMVELEGLEPANRGNAGVYFGLRAGGSNHEDAQKVIDKMTNAERNAVAPLTIGAAVGVAVVVDIFVTKGWMSRTMAWYMLGNEINATDRYNEAKANGNKESEAKYKEQMETYGPGATMSAFTEVAPVVASSIMKGARKSLAMKWMGSESKTKYINFNKQVYTKTYTEGSVLYQYRVPGKSEGSFFVTSLSVTPEEVGLLSSKYTEVYKVTTTAKKVNALVSTHIKDAKYFADGVTPVKGGGKQIFSKEINSSTAKFEKINP
ncbi:MAG: polymorphic toxin type 46 domain-containing protein [Brumimicrobium sp.]|nr:polymorphic toxin type 46 domain-containing protein [Brumimicrobium sp.]